MQKGSRRARGRSDYDEVKAAIKRYYRLNQLSKVIGDPQRSKIARIREEIFNYEITKIMNTICRRIELNLACIYLKYLIEKVKEIG